MLCQFCLRDLVKIREEWEQATQGDSLLDVRTSVGLLLDDICQALALNPAQRFAVLGERLAGEIGFSLSMDLAEALVYAVDGDLPVDQPVNTTDGFQVVYTGNLIILDGWGKSITWKRSEPQLPAIVE